MRRGGLVQCVDPLRDASVSGEIHYFPFHGLGGYRSYYTDADLLDLRDGWCKGKMSYVMFKNISMVEDAHRFEAFVRSGN
jgi:uncharacterized protein YecE (DUF72 family)